jgi:transposase
MLGLPGFRLLAAEEVRGELEVTVETSAARVGCDACRVVATLHDRREVVVRDVDAFWRRSRLRWRKRVCRCDEPLCAARTWTERSDAIRPRQSLAERVRKEACRRVGRGESLAAVARDRGTGWHTIMKAVREHGVPLVDDPARTASVPAVGVDETSFPEGDAAPLDPLRVGAGPSDHGPVARLDGA